MDKFLDILARVLVYTFFAAIGAAYIYVVIFKAPVLLLLPYFFALAWALARMFR